MSALDFVQNERKTKSIIWVISLIIPIVVTALRYIPTPELSHGAKESMYFLPLLNSILNGSTFFLLIAALFAIRSKNINRHRKLMTTAMVFSALFLVSYVIFHWTTPEQAYEGEGGMKIFYYIILITHVLLSAAIVPLVLFAFSHAVAGRIDKHKKIVKVTYPMWLYVTFTGVLVYIMISAYYPVQIL